jgi:hypothetical protein
MPQNICAPSLRLELAQWPNTAENQEFHVEDSRDREMALFDMALTISEQVAIALGDNEYLLGQCEHVTIAGPRDNPEAWECLSKATVFDLRTEQEKCLKHFGK